ncbi:hypothetical protein J6590_004966 [Homalodisca vitripennis]|nr:hypothetical protein J6590_004966 [Homalodisca vitripennis]
MGLAELVSCPGHCYSVGCGKALHDGQVNLLTVAEAQTWEPELRDRFRLRLGILVSSFCRPDADKYGGLVIDTSRHVEISPVGLQKSLVSRGTVVYHVD